MVHQCFLCSGEIRTRTSQNSNKIENSILLYQILELPHLGNDVKKLSEINYCSVCASRILGIRVMLEELERLETRVLDEKYLIEIQLKENSTINNSRIPSHQLRSQIVTELRSTTIQSMLKKIRKKQVGRKLRPRHVRIMQNVTIPKIWTNSNDPRIDPNSVDVNRVEVETHDMNIQSDDNNLETVVEPDTSYLTEPEMSWATNTEEYDIKYETLSPDQPDISNDYELDSVRNEMIDPIVIPTTSMAVETGSAHYDLVEESGEYEEVEFPQAHPYALVETSLYGAGTSSSSSSSNQLNFHHRLQSNFPLGNSTVSHWKYSQGHSRKSWNKIRSSKVIPGHRSKKCEECGKILSCYETWKYHVLSLHRGQNEFKCPLCSYACPRQATLKIHMMSHSDIRNFMCSICEKSFKYKGDLKKHLRIHT